MSGDFWKKQEKKNQMSRSRIYSNQIIVAAADTLPEYQENADLVCTGIHDEAVIQQALNRAAELRSATVILLDGTYRIDAFPENDGDGNRAALVICESSQLIVFRGMTGEKSPVIHVTREALSTIREGDRVSVITVEKRPINTLVNNFSDFRMNIDGMDRPLIAINNYYSGASMIDRVRLSCSGFGPGVMPVPGLVGIRCSRGNPNGTGQQMSNIGVFGFYEGYQLGGEHLVAWDLLTRNCYYGYTFGNYEYDAGVMEHPLTLINCCDELMSCLPLFARCGSFDQKNRRGMQQIDLIGFNMELRPLENPTLADVVPARELTPDSFCGTISFCANKFWHSYENAPDVQFWEEGSGHNFRTINAVHKAGGSTAERLTYIPQYMQEYYDLDLRKKLIFDGREWVDYNGNPVK